MSRLKRRLTSRLILGLLVALFFSPAALTAAELTAREVIEKVDKRDDGDTRIADMTMILIDRKNNQRIRKIKSYSKDYGEDTKNISFFLTPADVRNTTFLSFDWDDPNKEDDNWLYLPALRKVKRISAGNKKDSFMGSDFSYADMNGMEIEEWNYKFLKKSVMIDGKDHWVIAGIPKKKFRKKVIKETGYLKSITWVRKDIFMSVKSKIWVKKGKKIKYFKALSLKKIQGIWTAEKVEMITTKRKKQEHATVLLLENTIYNKGVDDSFFTTQRMERGL